ncbi:chemotaxis response regulator protein-glutamate methylesterase [Geothrix sp. 21YS21S-4]|uniref:protein-glutamate methylesterase/protein-glutamine glutaminase n=1 Tax=Geothrix sp. 21YS21S-4 TaxID=3068889 RepID=UPI0027BACBE1|nr:chemotaxis response regulator protein-glutamate methylesterase [Geothrix sp. 21YS21S-4]
MNAKVKSRVLVVDDSALVRQTLSSILVRHGGLEVVGSARDPYDAREKIKELDPDVLTLDVEMPRMDGLTFLGKLMKAHPLPVVMLSSLTAQGTSTALDALALGAVDVIGKPVLDQAAGLEAMGTEIAETVYAASLARVRPLMASTAAAAGPVAPLSSVRKTRSGRALIAVGASTGGTEALRRVFETIPGNLPPVVVVQHMLPGFMPAFADRLDRSCAAKVKVAEDHETLQSGTVYLGPSGCHLTVIRQGAGLAAHLQVGERISRHLPSVDALFQSVAEACGPHALGAILTGMGDDGARGLLEMRQKGARTLGQDEATCVVYGMPRAAWSRGAVQVQVPLADVARHLAEWSSVAV